MIKTRYAATPPLDASLVLHYTNLLTNAFGNDLLYMRVLPRPERRRFVLAWMHSRVIRYCLRYGHIVTTPHNEGISCWLAPGHKDITMWRIIRSGLFAMPFVFGPAAYRRFDEYLEVSLRLRSEKAPAHYWYLWVIGVATELQGRGIGGNLIRPVLEKADTSGQAIYLETENEKNVRFYEKHGFHVIAEEKIASLDIVTRPMIRLPS